MEMTRLGPDGPEVSRIGLGGCPIGGHGWGRVDDSESVATIVRALDEGVNLFDTADVYGFGHSEEVLSRALGGRRHEVVIASKFGVRWAESGKTRLDTSPGYLEQALHDSLRRLKVDCIPLYYIHWPDGTTPIAETVAALSRYREQGKIRWIGLSNFGGDQIVEAADAAAISTLQIQYSLLDRDKVQAVAQTCRTAGIPLVTWGSLSQGLLTGKFTGESTFDPADRRSRYPNFQGERFQQGLALVETLRELAGPLAKTPAQISLRWLLDRPEVGCVLFGAKRPQQLLDNLGALDWSLPPHARETLDSWSIAAGEAVEAAPESDEDPPC